MHTAAELASLLDRDDAAIARLDARSAVAARSATALSSTPVPLDASLVGDLRQAFSRRAIVVLASSVAQVNFWSRFNQGLGVPAAGFFDESSWVPPAAPRAARRRRRRPVFRPPRRPAHARGLSRKDDPSP